MLLVIVTRLIDYEEDIRSIYILRPLLEFFFNYYSRWFVFLIYGSRRVRPTWMRREAILIGGSQFPVSALFI